MLRPLTCIIALTLALPALGVENEPNPPLPSRNLGWPQWRGPNRDGIVIGKSWPDSISADHLKARWSVDLGPSYSGPIIADGKVFVTETLSRKFEVARAFDLASGKQIWEARWEGAMSVPFFAKANGDWIRATPAYDEGRLFVAGIRDVLVCLDTKNGEEVWRVDFVKEFKSPLPSFGMVSSPLIIGKHVFVQAGGGFIKLDKATGAVVWRVASDGGGMWGSAFSSPYLAEIQGVPQILVQTRTSLVGVTPQDGAVLWKQDIPAFRGMNIVTPTVSNDSVFTSSYGGKSFLFSPKRTESGWDVDEVWRNKVQGYMSSPIVIDGHVYVHLRNQRFACIDLATGKETWITKPFGKYWSLIGNGDKILALDERGELLLIRANPQEFELLERRSLGDNSWAHLAISDETVAVRELNKLTVYGWR